MYVELSVEGLRTGVQFPPAPPIQRQDIECLGVFHFTAAVDVLPTSHTDGRCDVRQRERVTIASITCTSESIRSSTSFGTVDCLRAFRGECLESAAASPPRFH